MRVLTVTLASLLLAVAPATAADDPLLSGYSGPGGGDQSLLGSGLVPPGKGGGSLKAPAPTVSAAVQGVSGVPATQPDYPALKPSPPAPGGVRGARGPGRRAGSSPTKRKASSPTPAPAASTPSEPPTAASAPPARDRASAGASLFTFANVLGVVLGLVVLGATALGTARLSAAAPRSA